MSSVAFIVLDDVKIWQVCVTLFFLSCFSHFFCLHLSSSLHFSCLSSPCVCRFLIHASLSFKLNCITLMSDSMFSTTLTSLSLLPAVFSVLCSPLFFILQYSLSAVLCVDPLCLPDKWMLGSYSDLEQTVDSHFTIYTQLSPPPLHSLCCCVYQLLFIQSVSSMKKY